MEQVLIFLSAFLVMSVYTLLFFYYHKGKHKRYRNLPKNAETMPTNTAFEEGPALELPPGVCWLPPDASDPSLKDSKIRK